MSAPKSPDFCGASPLYTTLDRAFPRKKFLTKSLVMGNFVSGVPAPTTGQTFPTGK